MKKRWKGRDVRSREESKGNRTKRERGARRKECRRGRGSKSRGVGGFVGGLCSVVTGV